MNYRVEQAGQVLAEFVYLIDARKFAKLVGTDKTPCVITNIQTGIQWGY